MRRLLAPLVAAAALAAPWPAAAEVRDVSMGNYWYEDDSNGRRDGIVVREGDQIRFTVREPDYPPHSINSDELGWRSGDLLLFEQWTTPRLTKTGTFRIYCEAHQDRGHVGQVIVQPAAQQASSPTPATPQQQQTRATQSPRQATTAADPDDSATSENDPAASTEPTEADDVPSIDAPMEDEEIPSGRSVATDGRRAEPDPDSLAGLLGRQPGSGPWTHGVRLALVAGIPIWALTAFALRRQRARERVVERRLTLPTAEPVVVVDLSSNQIRIQGNGAATSDAEQTTVR